MPKEQSTDTTFESVFGELIEKQLTELKKLSPNVPEELEVVLRKVITQTVVDMVYWSANYRVRLMSVRPSDAVFDSPPTAEITIEATNKDNW